MNHKSFEMQRLENAASDLKEDYVISTLYYAGKCATTVGGILLGGSSAYDLLAGKYASAITKGVLTFLVSRGYKFLDKKMNDVSRRINRNKIVLEERLAEDYGK